MNRVPTNAQVFHNPAIAAKYFAQGKLVGDNLRLKIPSDQGLPDLLGEQHFLIRPQGKRLLNGLTLNTDISAISKTGGTYVRGVDALGLLMINNIEIRQNSKVLNRITAAQMWEIVQQMSDESENVIMNARVGIDSQANRATRAASPTSYCIDFAHFFGMFSVPLPVYRLDAPLEVVVTYAGPASLLVETDGTAPTFSFVASNLIATFTEVPQMLTNEIDAMSVYPIYAFDYQEMVFDIPAATASSFSYNLQQLNNKDVILINTIVRPAANFTTANACDYTTCTAVSSYTLKSSNNYISGANFDFTDTFMRQNLLHEYDFPAKDALYTQNIYPISYSTMLSEEFSDHGHKYTGSKSFRNVTDAQLTLNFASTVAAAQKVHVNAICCRRILIGPKGEVKISE